MKEITTKYTNGEVTVVWKPKSCIHSTFCWRGLPEVFNPSKRPWVMPENSTTKRIIEQVEKCPSGALSYYINDGSVTKKEIKSEHMVEVTPNGPLLIYGDITVKDKEGNKANKEGVTSFCRCGGSCSKPYCDGTHKRINFSD
ncbi:MAG: (4Fe-4S)-binding protein [Bacteroidota bacterium]|nr:(4Fe-4S)-binding protein [Bacteroidota bacterium]